MGNAAAYALSVSVGLAGGVGALTSFRSSYQVSRDRPPTAKYAVVTGVVLVGLTVFLAWVFGQWNGIYLAGMGMFTGVFWFGTLVWPLFRT